MTRKVACGSLSPGLMVILVSIRISRGWLARERRTVEGSPGLDRAIPGDQCQPERDGAGRLPGALKDPDHIGSDLAVPLADRCHRRRIRQEPVRRAFDEEPGRNAF